MDSDGQVPLWNYLIGLVKNNLGVFIVLLVLIALSAYFSGAETALSASNRIKLKSEADKNDRRAAKMLAMQERFDTSLTSVLFGNDLVNIATGSLTAILALRLGINEMIMTLIITAVVIIFGEVLPKAIVKSRVDDYAVSVAPSLFFATKILSPFAYFFSLFSKLIKKLFDRDDSPSVTEEDLHDIIEDIDESGSAEKDEVNLLYSAFEFEDINATDIYTPIDEMVALDLEECRAEDILDLYDLNRYSRLPVYERTKNNIKGVLRIRTFLEKYGFDRNTDISSMLDEPVFVGAGAKADDILSVIQEKQSHLVFVKSRNGRILGIITIEDILEELVGEIFDEEDVVEDKFRVLGDDLFEISSGLSVVSAFELMEYEDFDRDECGHETMLTWANKQNKKTMHRGDVLKYNNLEITAGKARHSKTDKFIVRILPAENGEAEQ